jgi:DNA-binding transcriptional MocR family regulator
VNSGPTSERVYDTLRERLLTRVYSPGQRLDPSILARELTTSITPVRDALHLLAGRGLVVIGTGEGFHVGHIDAPALGDLYLWNLGVLMLALRSWPKDLDCNDNDSDDDGASPGDPALQISAICIAIGRLSPNAEHRSAIESLNDRLHPIRLAEVGVIDDPESELHALQEALNRHDRRVLQRLLALYHRKRLRKAAEIVRTHYRR